jgi:hypothetical protein
MSSRSAVCRSSCFVFGSSATSTITGGYPYFFIDCAFASVIASTRFTEARRYSESNANTRTVPCVGSFIVSCATLCHYMPIMRFLTHITATSTTFPNFLERVGSLAKPQDVYALRAISGLPLLRFLKKESRERGRDVDRADFARLQREVLENYLIGLIRAVASTLLLSPVRSAHAIRRCFFHRQIASPVSWRYLRSPSTLRHLVVHSIRQAISGSLPPEARVPVSGENRLVACRRGSRSGALSENRTLLLSRIPESSLYGTCFY